MLLFKAMLIALISAYHMQYTKKSMLFEIYSSYRKYGEPLWEPQTTRPEGNITRSGGDLPFPSVPFPSLSGKSLRGKPPQFLHLKYPSGMAQNIILSPSGASGLRMGEVCLLKATSSHFLFF